MSFSLGASRVERPLYDIAIIGAGPGGTTAAIYGARARLKVALIDKAKLGGALGMTAKIANWPGSGYERQLGGAELLRLMHEHAEAFGAEFVQSEVYAVSLDGEVKEIITAEGVIRAKTVIIATGAGSRDNKLPGEEEFLGRGVSHCATCDAAFYAGRTVVVVGNSQEAVEEALTLAKFAGTVKVVCQTAKLVAEEQAVAALAACENVSVLPRYHAKAIEGQETVTGLLVTHPGGEEVLPADGVFMYLPGNRPAIGFLAGQVELDERGFIKTNAELETSTRGVYAVGDVRGAAVQQVVVAAADGCMAALAAERFISKRGRLLSQR